MKFKAYVKKIKTFERKSGAIGQEVVIRNPDGYSCSIRAVDKNIKDLSGVSIGEHSLDCELEFYLIKGERFYTNVLGFKVLDID